MTVEARFKCTGKTSLTEGSSITFSATYNDGLDNKDWSKYTPAGQLSMVVTNPGAEDQFVVGTVYKLTFEAV